MAHRAAVTVVAELETGMPSKQSHTITFTNDPVSRLTRYEVGSIAHQGRRKMGPKTWLSIVLLSGLFTIATEALAYHEEDRRHIEWSDSSYDIHARHLQGRWYLNGDSSKPTGIHMNGRRLEATNENGRTSRLEIDRRGDVRASDWQGLRGDVKGNRIEWSNGTTWTRRPSDKYGDARQLQGRWYVNGDSKKLAEINADGRNLRARNENGDITRLEVERDGDVRALDWRGLHGDVRRDRIEWANGTTWTKSPERLSRR